MYQEEQRIYIAFTIALALLCFFLVYYVITIIQYQKKKNAFMQKKVEAEIQIIEKEKKRIAEDLHDDLGALLSTVKMQIGSVIVSDKEDEQVLRDAMQNLDESIYKLRSIAFELLPTVLIRKGLALAIKEFCDTLNRTESIRVHFDNQLKQPVPMEVGVHLYRVVQEAINNTMKHGRAGNIEITLKATDKELELYIDDDGIGFSAESLQYGTTGLGISSMNSRVELLKGKLYLMSSEGTGTHYKIQIPTDAGY